MGANFHDGAIIGRRKEQQDHKTNLILPHGYRLYVLADGMGGHKAGSLAATTVCLAFCRFVEDRPMGNPRTMLQQAMEYANESLANILQEQPELKGMGTTLLAVLMHESTNGFSFISVGDSPLYCLRGQRLVRLNANHAYLEFLHEQVRAGIMTAAEAARHPGRHAVTSALMGGRIEEVDLKSDRLRPDELLLMASDGVHTLSDAEGGEIEAILKRGGRPSLEKAVDDLFTAIEKCNAPNQDNTTLILIQPAHGGAPAAEDGLAAREDSDPTVPLRWDRVKESGEFGGLDDPDKLGKQGGDGGESKERSSIWPAVLVMILLILALAGAGAYWWRSEISTSKLPGQKVIEQEQMQEHGEETGHVPTASDTLSQGLSSPGG